MKICHIAAFFGSLLVGMLSIRDGWHSYSWPFIAAIWIANSYILESRLEKEVL